VITGIVLAGGRASRLGGAKLGLEVGGRSLLELAVTAVGAIADEVVVAGPPAPGLDAGPGRPISFVEDRVAFPGPLAALASALEHAKGDLAIVVAGDMPFLVPDVLTELVRRLAAEATIDAVLLGADPGAPRQVLPLAVRVEPVLAAARATLDAGDRSLVRLLDRIAAVEIPAVAWRALDPEARTLVDIDEPADLERWSTT
jgi:molybdopterin-guanine dinucleotide biosynthesis protein A